MFDIVCIYDIYYLFFNKKGGIHMNKKKIFLSLTVIAVMLMAFMLMGVSCSASTANVTNATMTSGTDENYAPVDTVSGYAAGSIATVAAELHNAPDDTTITFKFYANDVQVDEYSVSSQGQSDVNIACGSDQTSEIGNYRVEIYIDERTDPDATVEFTVE